VNQQGERIQGFDVNTLTVIANESYESFASNLQSEIESATGVRFGIVEKHLFAAIITEGVDGQVTALGRERSEALWKYLKEKKLIDDNGKVLDTLRRALRDGALKLPSEFKAQYSQIIENLRKVSGRLDIKDAGERKPIPLNDAIYKSVEFKELWNRIKRHTTYRVEFDDEKLIKKCAHALQKALTGEQQIKSARLQWITATLDVTQSGVTATKTSMTSPITLKEEDIVLPDLLTELQNRTQLTRRSIAEVLTGSERLDDFKLNPQQFIEVTTDIINRQKNLILTEDENGIKYQQMSEDDYYCQKMFEREELMGYVGNMLQNTKKSLFTSVICDSDVEKKFAEDMDINEAIKLYAKLPGWFKVPTPLGSYNPDWAVLVELDGQQHLYLVVETKGSLFGEDRRATENFKIHCGKKHFDALATGENPAHYTVENSVENLLDLQC
jgi:type III restriction enzyme